MAVSKDSTRRAKLSEYRPVGDSREIKVPCIPQGDLARTLYDITANYVKNNFGRDAASAILKDISFDESDKTIVGSRFAFVNFLGQLLRRENPMLDVVSHRDLTRPDVAALTKGIYLDAQDALVLRDTNEFYDERDRFVFAQLQPLVDNLRTPALLTGLRVKPATKKEVEKYGAGYGFSVVPIDGQFKFSHDKRKFGEEGWWLESDFAVSGLCRSDAGLGAYWGLAGSDRDGRVALVSRAAGTTKN